MQRIYLDNNASTPIAAEVLQVVMQQLAEELGNPSSIHCDGKRCRRRLEESRQVVARYFGVKSHEVIFTSGATEGAATLLQGIMRNAGGGHVISSAIEHACVYQTLRELQNGKVEVSFLRTGTWGAVQPAAVADAIRPNTKLIVLMAVNNETGVKTDLEAIACIAQRAHIPLVVDATAWVGKELIQLPNGVSAIFFSGHKIHAPKGVGACISRQTLKWIPLLEGGGQELNRRGGTENLPGIVALAKALSILENEQAQMIMHMSAMRNLLEGELQRQLGSVIVNGDGPRVCNTSNLAFSGVDGEALLIGLDAEGLSVSHGSACSSGALEPSRVLLEMGLTSSLVNSSIRFSLSRMTTELEIREAIVRTVRVVNHLRALRNVRY